MLRLAICMHKTLHQLVDSRKQEEAGQVDTLGCKIQVEVGKITAKCHAAAE